MPAAQCPECGRFLSKGFVTSLAVEPAGCPKCGTELTAAHFPDELGQAAAPEGPTEEPAGAADLREEQPEVPDVDQSVRPPDLEPAEVRLGEDDEKDPLAGWDEEVTQLDRFRQTSTPPPDGAIVAGAALAGAAIGAIVAEERRAAGAGIGAVLGALAGAAARQVWRLPDDA